MNTDYQSMMMRGIQTAISTSVSVIVQEEAAKAADAVRKRIQESGASIATNVMTWHRMEMRGDEIVITINIPQHDRPTSSN